jgi:hypothetical protein
MPPERSLILIVTASLIAVASVLVPEAEVEELRVWRRTKTEIVVYVEWSGPNVFELYLDAGNWSAADIIAQLFSEMQDVLADSEMAWGRHARRACRVTRIRATWSAPAPASNGRAPHRERDGRPSRAFSRASRSEPSRLCSELWCLPRLRLAFSWHFSQAWGEAAGVNRCL